MNKETQDQKLPYSYTVSAEGLQALVSRPRDPKYPFRHMAWTDDFTV